MVGQICLTLSHSESTALCPPDGPLFLSANGSWQGAVLIWVILVLWNDCFSIAHAECTTLWDTPANPVPNKANGRSSNHIFLAAYIEFLYYESLYLNWGMLTKCISFQQKPWNVIFLLTCVACKATEIMRSFFLKLSQKRNLLRVRLRVSRQEYSTV